MLLWNKTEGGCEEEEICIFEIGYVFYIAWISSSVRIGDMIYLYCTLFLVGVYVLKIRAFVCIIGTAETILDIKSWHANLLLQ